MVSKICIHLWEKLLGGRVVELRLPKNGLTTLEAVFLKDLESMYVDIQTNEAKNPADIQKELRKVRAFKEHCKDRWLRVFVQQSEEYVVFDYFLGVKETWTWQLEKQKVSFKTHILSWLTYMLLKGIR